MKQDKLFVIEWYDSSILSVISAANEDEAISKLKARLGDDLRDDPDLITDIREVSKDDFYEGLT